MAIRDWPSDERPREKLLEKGAAALSDAELLAILLRTGTAGRSPTPPRPHRHTSPRRSSASSHPSGSAFFTPTPPPPSANYKTFRAAPAGPPGSLRARSPGGPGTTLPPVSSTATVPDSAPPPA